MQLFKNLKSRIPKSSIITWSAMGKQTAQAKEVHSKGRYKQIAIAVRGVLQNKYYMVKVVVLQKTRLRNTPRFQTHVQNYCSTHLFF